MRWIAAQGRLKVKLDDGGRKLAVKTTNLLPLLSAGSTHNLPGPRMCRNPRVRTALPTIAGATAVIQNLKTQQYNGLRCIVKKYDRPEKRYSVRLQRDGKRLSLKAENLR